MIERLRGRLLHREEDHLVLDVQGVGYGLDAPRLTLERLPDVGEEAELFTVLVVSQDDMRLYGFATAEEQKVFEIFRAVSGIGPRTALDVLSTLSIAEFVQAIRFGQVQALTRVPGIGKKKAERLIVELKDRLKQFPAVEELPGRPDTPPPAPADAPSGEDALFQDALDALVALGFKSTEASRQVSAALRQMEDETLTVEAVVKTALQRRNQK